MTDARRFVLPAGHPVERWGRIALVAAGIGVALSIVGALASPQQFLRSYLVAWVYWVQVALGCLAVLMIKYVAGGAWGAVIRRLAESGTRTLPLMALLFVPVALGLPQLYEWADPRHVAHDPLLQHKAAYLNVPFFLARAVLYFAVWIAFARWLERWSIREDETAGPHVTHRLDLISRGGLVSLGLTMTFAAFDWTMSLEPHWFSTIYGVIFMGASVLSAFALLIAMAAVMTERGPFRGVVTPGHLHDLGKLLLAFVLLYAYFNYSQFVITWAGNLPEEIPWYLRRVRGGWGWIVLLIVVFHFALPFLVLLARDVKRRARWLAGVAIALGVMRVIDTWWFVTPAFDVPHPVPHWLDLATLVGIGGLWLAVFFRRLAGRPLLPLADPSLPIEVEA
jgi:hypothetical protein